MTDPSKVGPRAPGTPGPTTVSAWPGLPRCGAADGLHRRRPGARCGSRGSVADRGPGRRERRLADDRVVLGVGPQLAGRLHVGVGQARRPARRSRCGRRGRRTSPAARTPSGLAVSPIVQTSQAAPVATSSVHTPTMRRDVATDVRRRSVRRGLVRSPVQGDTYDATHAAAPPGGPRAGLRLMHVHAHPDDESSKGAASTAMYVAAGRRRARGHLHRRRAGLDPQPQDGSPRRAGEHDRDPPSGDGAGPRHPRRAPGLARLRRLRAGPRATRSRRCPRAASGWSRSRRRRPRWSG